VSINPLSCKGHETFIVAVVDYPLLSNELFENFDINSSSLAYYLHIETGWG
jgi:hypothetical protein